MTGLDERSFEAEVLAPGRAGSHRRLELEIPRKLVRNADAHLLVEGSAFYYCVGRSWVGDEIIPDTVLWFRRYIAPEMTDTELHGRAQALFDGVGWTD